MGLWQHEEGGNRWYQRSDVLMTSVDHGSFAGLLQLHLAHDTATLHEFVGKISNEDSPGETMAHIASTEVPELVGASVQDAWTWLEARAATGEIAQG